MPPEEEHSTSESGGGQWFGGFATPKKIAGGVTTVGVMAYLTMSLMSGTPNESAAPTSAIETQVVMTTEFPPTAKSIPIQPTATDTPTPTPTVLPTSTPEVTATRVPIESTRTQGNRARPTTAAGPTIAPMDGSTVVEEEPETGGAVTPPSEVVDTATSSGPSYWESLRPPAEKVADSFQDARKTPSAGR